MAGKRKTNRALSVDDLDIWRKVVEKIDPLIAKPTVQQIIMTKPTVHLSQEPVVMISPFKIGERAQLSKNTVAPRTLSSDMDKRNYERLRKGKFQIDARLDLHGLTLAQAHTALNAFILRGHQEKKRLLLVITGKSSTHQSSGIMPERRGVIKQQVPHWLRLPPLAPLVLETTIATRKHGGEGALYVYLRRQR